MTFETFISENNTELIQITKNITKNHIDSLELYQFVVLQILTKPPKKEVVDNQKKYYFIRLLKNNWFSSTSRYHYEFRKKVYNHLELSDFEFDRYEIVEDLPNDNIPTLEWIREELNTMGWYKRDLFTLWSELLNITQVSKKTTIPIGTCGKQIREIKDELNKRWEQYSQRC